MNETFSRYIFPTVFFFSNFAAESIFSTPFFHFLYEDRILIEKIGCFKKLTLSKFVIKGIFFRVFLT